jgi:hypothetical protein
MPDSVIPRVIFLFLICLSLKASGNSYLNEKKICYTHRLESDVPVIDGKSDDPAWQKLEWEKGFVQHEPYEGNDPSQETGFKILYDDDNIYIAFKAYDTNPDSIDNRITRKDNSDGDIVAIQLDSYFDQRTAFTFMVSASGVKTDGIFSNDGENEDYTWDPIWFVKTLIDGEGWNAEMKIPLSQLRFDKEVDQVWGLQVARLLFRKQELSLWQPIPRDAPGWVHQFGELHGISGITPKRQVEIAPYVVASTERFKKDGNNPFATGKLNNFNAGVDGKIGITNNMIIDFTLNPDFGQVEADPSQVNLSAYEIFFEEKRPFFIEGKNIFNSPLNFFDGDDLALENLFYSRRIGRNPQYSPEPDSGEYVDVPTSTSILGAAKLTGKTKNGLSYGILESVTAREKAEIDNEGERNFETAEPLTNYAIARVQKDFNKGNTILGGIFTATNRSIEDQTLDFLHTSAYTGGLDFTHSWKERTYSFMAKTYFSNVRGSRESLILTQESSARYFQRPDNNYTKLDSGRTSLSGYGGTVGIGKFANGHLRYAGFVYWKSPGLELNDLGFMPQTDEIMQVFWVGYRIWEPFSIFRELNINFNQWTFFDFGGNLNNKGGNININTQFKNYWSLSTGINPQFSGRSNSMLRGGPSIYTPGTFNTWLDIESDERKKLNYEVYTQQGWGMEKSSRSQSYGISLTYRPIDALDFSLNPNLSLNNRDLQYIQTEPVESGDQYIFASIRQKTLRMSLRINFNIGPNLTFQYWGQPFISAGKYSEFKKITNPHAEEYSDRFYTFDDEIAWDAINEVYQVNDGPDLSYTIDNPDFNVKEFKSNFVIRWEYVPGSTLYVVWSQGRDRYNPYGEFDIDRDMKDMFDIHPHDIFLIKLSYRFGL